MEYPTVFPGLSYVDAEAAIEFLVGAFGAERHAVYRGDDGKIVHAELRFGNGIVMLGPFQETMPPSRGVGVGISVFVDDPDAHCERARAAGAEIIQDPEDTPYGARVYGARDPEGNEWYFGTYQPFLPAQSPDSAAPKP